MKNILLLTSSFPSFEGETDGNFIFELSKNISKKNNIIVNTPYKPNSKLNENMEGFNVKRYKYFFPKNMHVLTGGAGIGYNISNSLLAKIQVPFFLFSQIISSLALIRKHNIDIVNSHWLIPQGISGMMAKLVFNIKHVVTIHGHDINIISRSKILKIIANYIFKYTDVIIVNSSFTKKLVKKHLKNHKNKLHQIPIGMDPYKFNFTQKKGIKSKSADLMILGIGALIDYKGFDYLIQAFEYLLKDYPNSKLIIIGEGYEKENLLKLSKKLGINEKIEILGWIKNDELPEYYRKADIFVMPRSNLNGKTEGLGIVTMEAMSCGTPVVGTNVGGIPDVIENEYNGYLVPEKSPKILSDRIIHILDNPDIYYKFSKNGRLSVEKKFSWASISKEYDDIFISV